MRLPRLLLSLVILAAASSTATAQDFKIEAANGPAPADLAAPIRDRLQPEGYRVFDGEGKLYAEVWLCKATPASEAPTGPKGAVLYPFLAEGELLGALRYPEEGYDSRDQSIAKGTYTLRYGLQPVNGDHLGISTHRDYALLLPAAKDTKPDLLAQKPLEKTSAEAAGTSHPAILLMVAVKAGAKAPSMVHVEEKDAWGAVVPLGLEVKGSPGTATQTIQLMIMGVYGS